MSWLKRDLINQAFEQIGLAVYVFDLSPEQLAAALKTMDSMLATWNAKGIRLGYPVPTTAGGSTLDQDSGLPDSAYEAVVMNLAKRLATTVGRATSQDVNVAAKQGYDILLARAVQPPEMRLPNTMPRGAGQKAWRVTGQPFIDETDDDLEAGPDGDLTFK